MCASHKGEDIHVDTALSMINKLGLGIDDFECGSHYPSDTVTRHKMIRKNEVATALHNNCSGKHAGMLALAKHLRAETKGYINEQHPVQRTITKVGGESVRGISLNTEKYGPIGVSIKILDGSFRAMPLAVMKLLEHLELLSEDEKNKLHKFRTKKLTNHNGIQIGHIEAHVDF